MFAEYDIDLVKKINWGVNRKERTNATGLMPLTDDNGVIITQVSNFSISLYLTHNEVK